MTREEVVGIQKTISNKLLSLIKVRKAKLDNFKAELSSVEEKLRNRKLPISLSQNQGSQRFIQNTDEMTMNSLACDVLLKSPMSDRKYTNFNITITNNNTNTMISPSKIGTPLSIERGATTHKLSTTQ
jgi:hypothetical protein